MLDCLKLHNNGGWHLSWRWWPFTILSTNLLEVMLLQWSMNFESVPTCTTDEDDENCDTSGTMFPMAPFLPTLSGTGWCTSCWLSAILTTVRLSVKMRLLWKGGTNKLWCRPFLNIKPEPGLWLGSDSPHRGWRLGQSKGGYVVGLCQGPVKTSTKANLTGMNRILNTVKKG